MSPSIPVGSGSVGSLPGQQTTLMGDVCSLRPGLDSQLLEDVSNVEPYSVHAKGQLLRDLFVRCAGDQKLKHVLLPLRKVRGRLRIKAPDETARDNWLEQ